MRTLLTIVLTLLILVLTGCGNERTELRDEIAAEMMQSSQGMIEQDDANCFADALIDALGVERARQYFQATTGDWEAAASSEPLTSEQQQKLAEGIMACGTDVPTME
jgi:uncharacterized lipoprotein NlpE involved in copper resistance